MTDEGEKNKNQQQPPEKHMSEYTERSKFFGVPLADIHKVFNNARVNLCKEMGAKFGEDRHDLTLRRYNVMEQYTLEMSLVAREFLATFDDMNGHRMERGLPPVDLEQFRTREDDDQTSKPNIVGTENIPGQLFSDEDDFYDDD